MLSIVIGPMYAGKTEYIIRLCRRYRVINKNVLVINNIRDNRYGSSNVISHNGTNETAICIDKLHDLIDMPEYCPADLVIIEEAQFFDDLYLFIVSELKIDKPKEFIISGLSGDYKKNKIGQILDLIPHAENVVKLNGLCIECKDGTLGSFTKRILHNFEEQIMIGGVESYKCVCRKHF